jgi:bifunctional UDP-N-acetylglucosamine pyrophosphorylase/glucosamine-1-phosphate N-acetyltransferase
MQAVILAAGLGTRMKPYTDKAPKPMINVLGKPILEYKLSILPNSVTEIIIIVNYKKEVIENFFGTNYKNKKIIYVHDKKLTGTAHALWQAKKFLKGRFLVLMGDDIYSKRAISRCAKYDWSIGCKLAPQHEKYSMTILDKNKNLSKFVTADFYYKNYKGPGLMFTGLYSMTPEIFKYKPVKLETREEWGLPQTLVSVAKNKKINIIKDKFWIPISEPLDIKKAEKELRQTKSFF